MGKGSRQKRQNGNNRMQKDDENKKIFQSKDDQICTKCENEISNLRELNQTRENEISNLRQLNQTLVKNIETSRAGKLAEMESQIHIHQADATNLQSKLDSMANERELLSQKNREMSTEAESLKARLVQLQGNERVLQQCRTENNDLQSDLNDYREKIQNLLRKAEEDTHLWDAKRNTLEGTIAALQTEHDLMASERRSLTQKYSALSNEVEFFKHQLNVLKIAEHSLKQQNETLQEEVNSTKCLLEKQDQRFAESTVENGRLKEQVEELSERFGELHETNVKLLQEKDEQRMDFESLLAQAAKRYRELEENHLKYLKQNEEHGKMIDSLHGDMILQLSRNKALEEELISTKESTVQIANLRSQLLTAVEEKDGQLSDLQRQLSAMAEEKKSQFDQLSSISAGKKLLEGENKSLQTELDRREEEKVRLEGRVRELQTTFNSLSKELESSKLVAEEKKGQLVDLQNQHSDLVKAEKCLEEKNESLVTELNRYRMVSKESVRLLQNRIRELETTMDSVKKDNENRIRELETSLDSVRKDNESKDNRIQEFMSMSERQPLQAKRLLNPNGNGNGKPNPIGGKEKPKLVGGKENHDITGNRTQKQAPAPHQPKPQKRKSKK